MKNKKYVVVIKRSIVALVILFVIVCFSFGATYSNFVYDSDDHRAVEMHISKLMYSIKINGNPVSEIDIKPGISRVSVEIGSLNEIISYYKLIVNKNDNLSVFYLDNSSSDKIKNNEKTTVNLLVFNSSSSNIKAKFLINGGYIINSISDIKVDEGYTEINKIGVGDYINYNVNNTYLVPSDYSTNEDLSMTTPNTSFRVLSINDDNTIDIISSESITLENVKFNGSNGYNNFNYIINDLCNSLYSRMNSTVKNISVLDIEKYSKRNLFSSNNLIPINKEIYIPSVLELDNSVMVNGNTGTLNSSDIILIDKLNSNKQVSSISIVENQLNNIEFDKNIYNELLLNDDYYVSTRMYSYDGLDLTYGIYNIHNGLLTHSNLYDSNNNDYEISNFKIRPIVKLLSNSKIGLNNNELEVK